jgi:hypothetical protein
LNSWLDGIEVEERPTQLESKLEAPYGEMGTRQMATEFQGWTSLPPLTSRTVVRTLVQGADEEPAEMQGLPKAKTEPLSVPVESMNVMQRLAMAETEPQSWSAKRNSVDAENASLLGTSPYQRRRSSTDIDDVFSPRMEQILTSSQRETGYSQDRMHLEMGRRETIESTLTFEVGEEVDPPATLSMETEVHPTDSTVSALQDSVALLQDRLAAMGTGSTSPSRLAIGRLSPAESLSAEAADADDCSHGSDSIALAVTPQKTSMSQRLSLARDGPLVSTHSISIPPGELSVAATNASTTALANGRASKRESFPLSGIAASATSRPSARSSLGETATGPAAPAFVQVVLDPPQAKGVNSILPGIDAAGKRSRNPQQPGMSAPSKTSSAPWKSEHTATQAVSPKPKASATAKVKPASKSGTTRPLQGQKLGVLLSYR